MKSVLAATAALFALAAADPAAAALSPGARAPEFSTPGADKGEVVTVDLTELLKQGPVVIYFFHSAFTEAAHTREFVEKFDRFRAAGASVVGVSRDDVETLQRFSLEEVRGKFPVASASESLVNAYDVNDGARFNTRTTYVVAPSGEIVFVHDDNEDRNHVRLALEFVEQMKR